MKRYRRSIAIGAWVVAMATLVTGVGSGYKFLPSTELGDGFVSQLLTVGTILSEGDSIGLLEESWLPLVHVVRFVCVTPFLAVESVLGPLGPLVMLMLLLWPLTRMPISGVRNPLLLLPLALPVLVSGRGVLVAVGLGYVVMHLLERRNTWMLWLGGLLCNLSSASVLMALLLISIGISKSLKADLPRSMRGQRQMVFILLFASFIISAIDKLAGFGSGDAGYEAHAFDSENLMMVIISRSTLVVSVVDGQYIRALVYGAIAALLSAKLISVFLDPRQGIERRILICCAPGMLMEGLGVLAMLFPLFWLFSGINTSSRLLAMPLRRDV